MSFLSGSFNSSYGSPLASRSSSFGNTDRSNEDDTSFTITDDDQRKVRVFSRSLLKKFLHLSFLQTLQGQATTKSLFGELALDEVNHLCDYFENSSFEFEPERALEILHHFHSIKLQENIKSKIKNECLQKIKKCFEELKSRLS
jgi:hypothetical protein